MTGRDLPKEPHSTVLSKAEEARVAVFRRHTLRPPDDCLYALRSPIPYLTRSDLHRCLRRQGLSRLPELDGNKPERQRFARFPIGVRHIDIAEVQTAEDKLQPHLFVVIDRISEFAFVRLEGREGGCSPVPARPDCRSSLPAHKVSKRYAVRKSKLQRDDLRAHRWPRVPRAWGKAQAEGEIMHPWTTAKSSG